MDASVFHVGLMLKDDSVVRLIDSMVLNAIVSLYSQVFKQLSWRRKCSSKVEEQDFSVIK